MSFFINILNTLSEFKWSIGFYTFIILWVYINREKFEKQASFMYLYKTKLGLNLMDTISGKFRKLVKFLGYIGIIAAYFGMAFISFMLVKNAYELIIEKPGVVGGGPVIPGFPLAGLGITFPLVIGWVSLFIIMIVHEFSHGVVARAHNVKVKSSGIAFFGPILGAFVEPDEKDIAKQPHRIQHSIFAAGPFSNIILTIVCIFIMGNLIIPGLLNTADTVGIKVDIIQNETLPAYVSGMQDGAVITKINDMSTSNYSLLSAALESLKPNQEIEIKTLSGETYFLTTASHPENRSMAYIGIRNFRHEWQPKTPGFFGNLKLNVLQWLYELLDWTQLISFAIGLMNLFPIFITDGAQMLRRNFEFIFKDKKKAFKYWKYVNLAAVFIVLILVFLAPLRNIYNFFLGLIF